MAAADLAQRLAGLDADIEDAAVDGIPALVEPRDETGAEVGDVEPTAADEGCLLYTSPSPRD